MNKLVFIHGHEYFFTRGLFDIMEHKQTVEEPGIHRTGRLLS